MPRVLMLPVLLALACLPTSAGEVSLKFSAKLTVEQFLTQAAQAGGGAFVYVGKSIEGKTIGGPYALTVPSEKFPDVVRFILSLRDISVRHYKGRFPLTVVLPDNARATTFSVTGLKTPLEFNRPPSAWRRRGDAVGTLATASETALLEALAADDGARSRAAAAMLGLCGKRGQPLVEALRNALATSDEGLRTAAAEALGRCGYAARSAIPGLRKRADQSEACRDAAEAIEGAVSPAMLDPTLATEKAPASFKVRFETTKGAFTIEVTRTWAPHGADRLYNLVKMGYFRNVSFFRVIEEFVTQFGIHGDPRVNAAWRSAFIKDDPVKQPNRRGYVSFAKMGRPNSRTVQLFVNTVDNIATSQNNLDAMGFAPIGRVIDGMKNVDALYGGYSKPGVTAPSQQRMQFEGNTYLKRAFPKLDYIKSTRIVP